MSAEKIALVTPYPPIHSGVSEYAKYISDSLAEENLKIYILTFTRRGEKPTIYREGSKIIIRVLSDNPFSILNFFRILKTIDPDVIHYNLHMTVWSKRKSLNFIYSAIPLISRIIYRKKVIVTLHNIIEFVDKKPLRKIYSLNSITKIFGYIATWLYSRVDNLVMLTKLYGEYMRKKYNAKITYIPHGFILGKNGYTKNNEDFSIGVFGFISPYKDYETVLKAYRKLKKINSNISLKIIGGPHPDFPEIYDRLKTHLYDGIKLTGYVPSDKLPNYLEDLDVIVLPYIGWAGVSGALHLAISLNKPIIISNIPEMKWLSRELGIEALFFNINDDNDLVKKIMMIYDDVSLRKRITSHNMKIAKKYDIRRIAELYMKLYGSKTCEDRYELS